MQVLMNKKLVVILPIIVAFVTILGMASTSIQNFIQIFSSNWNKQQAIFGDQHFTNITCNNCSSFVNENYNVKP